MSFSYEEYVNSTNDRQKAYNNQQSNLPSIGYFKLKNDQDYALVRINYESTKDFIMTKYHQIADPNVKWAKVECLNAQRGSNKSCPFCEAVKAGNKNITFAKPRLFVPMIAVNVESGVQGEAKEVVWDASATSRQDYARGIASLLNDFGDLRKHVFKIIRNGTGTDTSYSINYIPTYDKPEIVPVDFKNFEDFKITPHSYKVKTAEEMQTYLETGAFPEIVKPTEEIKTPDNMESPVAQQAKVDPVQAQPVAQPSTFTFNNDSQVSTPIGGGTSSGYSFF